MLRGVGRERKVSESGLSEGQREGKEGREGQREGKEGREGQSEGKEGREGWRGGRRRAIQQRECIG